MAFVGILSLEIKKQKMVESCEMGVEISTDIWYNI
jgi:hypothetical protein